MARVLWHGTIAVVLTLVSFYGGVAWLLSRLFRWRWFAFLGIYAALTLGTYEASYRGLLPRVAVTDRASTDLATQSALYPLLNRDYVVPEMHAVVRDLAQHMDTEFPGTVTLTLDGSFPLIDGFPLLPHLSHDDGEKLDLAFYWTDADGRYQRGKSKSPIGFWGYADGPTDCPTRWQDLRWDFPWLQRALPDYRLDIPRMRAALLWLAEDPRVSKVLIEPHILASTGLSHPKLRFQGCRAARHDDHIHFQL